MSYELMETDSGRASYVGEGSVDGRTAYAGADSHIAFRMDNAPTSYDGSELTAPASRLNQLDISRLVADVPVRGYDRPSSIGQMSYDAPRSNQLNFSGVPVHNRIS